MNLISIVIFIFEFESSIVFILICFTFYRINYNESILKCIVVSCIYWFCIYIPIEYISLDLAFIINFNDLTKDYYISPNKVELESMIIQFVFMLSSLYTSIYMQKTFIDLKKYQIYLYAFQS